MLPTFKYESILLYNFKIDFLKNQKCGPLVQ